MSHRELAKIIDQKLIEVSDVFGQFQKIVGLGCPVDCGKCCFKADISCSPYELLPMAFHLIDVGRAEAVLEKARLHKENHCLFLEVSDSASGTGRCSEYQHRPFICRAFGLAARRGKHEKIERSICKTLSEMQEAAPHIQFTDDEIPLIDIWKKNMESIDPHLLAEEVPIHQGIVILLEKLLLWKNLSEQS
jgi:Fe-S-cluster containining protein